MPRCSKSRLEDKRDKLEDERKDVANEYLLPSLAYANAAWAILALLYLVPASALTGRTLGKRFFWVRALHADGSPLGWGGSIKRYGAIIVSAAVLSSIPIVSVFAFPIVLVRRPHVAASTPTFKAFPTGSRRPSSSTVEQVCRG